MLVAAVTLALLSVSAVFALGGFEGSSDASSADALVLELQEGSGSRSESAASAKPVAVAVVNRRAARSGATTRRSVRRRDTVGSRAASTASTTASTTVAASQVDSLGDGTANQQLEAQEPSAPAVTNRSKPNLGDGVRQLGDGLSATVQQTGTALAQATAPLPAVSTTVQQVLNLVAVVIKGTTDALGGVLGARP